MKILLKLTLLISIMLSAIGLSAVSDDTDKYVRLGGKITVTKESEMWIKASVPFVFVSHPLLEKYKSSKPAKKDEVINLEYIDNIKIRLSLCFSNEFQKRALRNQKFPDAEFYQYYSAEVEFITLKLDRNTKYAHFLFPAKIAERDGFLSSYIKKVGSVVEIIYDVIPLKISDSIEFENYREERILTKFKEQSQANAPKNEGILIPAHLVSSSFLENAGPVKFGNKNKNSY